VRGRYKQLLQPACADCQGINPEHHLQAAVAPRARELTDSTE
jgi:hypothetical protein